LVEKHLMVDYRLSVDNQPMPAALVLL